MICNESSEEKVESSKKIIVEIIVKHGSRFANCQVKCVNWPGKSLLVGVKQGEKHTIPKGDTRIEVGDYLTILTDVNSECKIKEVLYEMNEPSNT